MRPWYMGKDNLASNKFWLAAIAAILAPIILVAACVGGYSG